MAFKEVNSLDAEITTALGGLNKKTGKPNPTKIEGYYLGAKSVKSPKAKSGFANIYILQTAKGNVGVWGKTDLDRKMTAVTPGTMIRITQSGTVPTPNGDMYKFRVEADRDNTIEVDTVVNEDSYGAPESAVVEQEAAPLAYGSDDEEETDVDMEEPTPDEVPAARVAAPKRPAAAPDADRQARVQALLNKARATK